MNDNITDLNIRNNSVRCAWGSDFFTITKTIGQASEAITLTPEEEQYLFDQLFEKRMPYGDAS